MPQRIEEKRMLLEQFYNISVQIHKMFSALEINEALSLINRKDTIIKNLLLLKEVKDDSYQDLKEKIKLQEEQNIELVRQLKDKIGQELKLKNKTAKMKSIYENKYNEGSIVDILE